MALATDAVIRNIPVNDDGAYVGPGLKIFTESTGSGAMAEALVLANNSVILGVKLHCASAPATSENFTAISDDIALTFINWNMLNETNFFQFWNPAFPFKAGTTINFAWANTNNVTWTLEVISREDG